VFRTVSTRGAGAEYTPDELPDERRVLLVEELEAVLAAGRAAGAVGAGATVSSPSTSPISSGEIACNESDFETASSSSSRKPRSGVEFASSFPQAAKARKAGRTANRLMKCILFP
jgi:hypothetical protein